MTTTNVTIRQAILHSADLLKKEITTSGKVVVLDRELGRMDISDGGAKLIVRIPKPIINTDNLSIGDVVAVTGILKKEERRTFLEGNRVHRST